MEDWHETTAQLPPAPPPLGLVVAMSEDRCIGLDGKLPWHISEDLKHFKRLTVGHAIIMGRKTFESIGRPLPKRRNIVITRRQSYAPDGSVEVATSLEEAIALARQTDPMPMIIGGASVYAEALPQVTTIYLTEVHRHVDGDAYFPQLDSGEWHEADRRPGEDGGHTFVTLERI
jgi:dihydrofolate reductase